MRRQSGTSIFEYCIIISLVSFVLVTILMQLGIQVNGQYEKVICSLQGNSCEMPEEKATQINKSLLPQVATEPEIVDTSETDYEYWIWYEPGKKSITFMTKEDLIKIFNKTHEGRYTLKNTKKGMILCENNNCKPLDKHFKDYGINLFPFPEFQDMKLDVEGADF